MSRGVLVAVVVLAVEVACGSPRDGDVAPEVPFSAGTIAAPASRPLSLVMPGARRPGAPIGTSGAVTGLTHSPDGRWVHLCQARVDTDGDGKVAFDLDKHGNLEGDRLDRYLVIDGGPGERIDDLVASSSDAARLVVRHDGVLVLVDVAASTVSVLPSATVAVATEDATTPTVATFSDDGTLVAYAQNDEVDVRRIADGVTRSFIAPGVVVGKIRSVGSRWLEVSVVDRDTDHDGSIVWPTALADRKPGACSWAVSTHGDDPSVRWIDLDHGETITDPAKLWPDGDRWVERAADGAITLAGQTLVPASCGAVVIGIHASPLRVIYVCATDPEHTFHVVGEDLATVDGPPWERLPPRDDLRELSSPSLCGSADGTAWTCVAYADGRVTQISSGFIGAVGNSIAMKRDGHYVAIDPTTGASRSIAPHYPGAYMVARDDSVLVFKQEFIIDFDAATMIGLTPDNAVGIDRNHRVLVASDVSDNDDTITGPLRWVGL